jgi:hypothetical protein
MKTPTEKACNFRRSMALTLMTRIKKKKNKFKRIITPITLILKEMTNYKKMPQTLWHEEMWLGSQDVTRRRDEEKFE